MTRVNFDRSNFFARTKQGRTTFHETADAGRSLLRRAVGNYLSQQGILLMENFPVRRVLTLVEHRPDLKADLS